MLAFFAKTWTISLNQSTNYITYYYEYSFNGSITVVQNIVIVSH